MDTVAAQRLADDLDNFVSEVFASLTRAPVSAPMMVRTS